MNLQDLPAEVLTRIQKFVPHGSQSSLRGASATTRNIPVITSNWKQACCAEPNRFEIADWILERANAFSKDPELILQAEQFRKDYGLGFSHKIPPHLRTVAFMGIPNGYLQKVFELIEQSFIFEDVSNPDAYEEIFITKTGKILHLVGVNQRWSGTSNEILKTREDLLQVLDNKRIPIRDQYYFTDAFWFMIKDIFLKRSACNESVVNECLLERLKTHSILTGDVNKVNNINYSQTLSVAERDHQDNVDRYHKIYDRWLRFIQLLDKILNDKGHQKIADVLISTIEDQENYDPEVNDTTYDTVGPDRTLTIFTSQINGLPDNAQGYEDNAAYMEMKEKYINWLNEWLQYLYAHLDPTDLV